MEPLHPDTAKLWKSRYENDEEVDESLYDAVSIPVEAHERWATCIAVIHRLPLAKGVPLPTMQWIRKPDSLDSVYLSLWYYRSPVDLEHQSAKPANAHQQVRARIQNGTHGQPATVMPNPLLAHTAWDELTLNADLGNDYHLYDLGELRTGLDVAGYRNTWDLESRRNGGRSTSPKKVDSSRSNGANGRVKAAVTNRNRADQRARDFLAAVDSGLTDSELCEKFNVKVGGLATKESRARKRIANQQKQR